MGLGREWRCMEWGVTVFEHKAHRYWCSGAWRVFIKIGDKRMLKLVTKIEEAAGNPYLPYLLSKMLAKKQFVECQWWAAQRRILLWPVHFCCPVPWISSDQVQFLRHWKLPLSQEGSESCPMMLSE